MRIAGILLIIFGLLLICWFAYIELFYLGKLESEFEEQRIIYEGTRISRLKEREDKFYKMKVKKEMSANKIIGMKEITDFLDGKKTLEQTKELIKQKTRQYAKRQFTWSRGHMKSWKMIYSPNFDDLLKKALDKIS